MFSATPADDTRHLKHFEDSRERLLPSGGAEGAGRMAGDTEVTT